MNRFREMVMDCPVIAAVKDEEGLKKSLETEIGIVFVLYGDLISLPDIVKQLKDAGRTALVHADLIGGLAQKEISVDFIKNNTQADGIISTRPALIKRARELDMYTVLRFFIIDSMAYDNIHKQCNLVRPDCIEVLPGVMPKVIRRICEAEKEPVIAGGLIADKEDIMMALEAGAVAISSTSASVWKM